MDELKRLKESKPGDLFWIGFRAGVNNGSQQQRLVVEENDGCVIVLRPEDVCHGTRREWIRIHVDMLR